MNPKMHWNRMVYLACAGALMLALPWGCTSTGTPGATSARRVGPYMAAPVTEQESRT